MTDLEGAKMQVVSTLAGYSPLAGVKVTGEFPPKGYMAPGLKPIIAVGIDKISLEPAGLGGFFGHSGGDSFKGAFASLEMGINCYCPQDSETLTPHGMFQEVCQCLLESDIPVSKLWSREIKPQKNEFANLLEGKIEMIVCLASKRSGMEYSDIIVRKKEGYSD